ncbi:hypothetical protein [Bacillus cereus group sp. BfR-BA-01310]|uniref:hypothetical protein n=1 Tax=Bacillus cereus group sp. BfR-BA-01310 TaxID=2920287 RepID=UPI001F599496|nr:hypothetical protein [Bacillus cereus group sp. BfR-BA-01310]
MMVAEKRMDKRDIAKMQKELTKIKVSMNAKMLFMTIALHDLSGKEVQIKDMLELTGFATHQTLWRNGNELQELGLIERKQTSRGLVFRIL